MSDEKQEYVSDGDDNSVDVTDVEDLDDDQVDVIDDVEGGDDVDDMDEEESLDDDLENKDENEDDKPIKSSINVIDDDDNEDGEDGEEYYDYDELENFVKFDDELKNNYIENYHPEEVSINYDEVKALCSVTRDRDGIIVDELHKSLPILTKYEYTNILGLRAKQINQGCKPFVSIDKEILDGYLIAQIELKQKMLPFIVKRPIPNGGIEYWRLSDLEILI
jgi:DNA-directed RNA polymerase I, II, and III subunit RPABC2|tara:strand:+ start:301 stop:963 length:663 start_codon:yes stop_codon:yes gene_type:complete